MVLGCSMILSLHLSGDCFACFLIPLHYPNTKPLDASGAVTYYKKKKLLNCPSIRRRDECYFVMFSDYVLFVEHGVAVQILDPGTTSC